MRKEKRVWVISEAYFPDESGSANCMTKLAEGLAKHYAVNVLCGYPSTPSCNSLPRKTKINGVAIERCFSTALNKNILFLRLVNILTISTSIFFKVLFSIRRQDVVVVVTTPPTLPFVVATACFLRRSRFILRIEDIYPDVLVAAEMVRNDSFLARIMNCFNTLLYVCADKITVLGRDMKMLVEKKIKKKNYDKVLIIYNWADSDVVFPKQKSENVLLYELGLMDKFIVECAGNMGLAQDIENMLKAVELLREVNDIHFLFIGSGAKKKWMQEEVRCKKLINITILDQRPRSDQHNFLNACDIAMVSLKPGMKGAGVPSRTYNIMAAGKPIIAISEFDSELSMVVEEEKIGWVVMPSNPNRLAETILEACSNLAVLAEMGWLAQIAAKTKYSLSSSTDKYVKVIEELSRAD